MPYFELLALTKEPFSNSPDPEFFYPTASAMECLHKLEVAIRLRRGLNVILGSVGSGKTTLSRVLLRSLEEEGDRFEIHWILDPGFSEDREMLEHLLRLFGVQPPFKGSMAELKDHLQKVLLQRALEEGRTVILLIDEGQKITPSGLEILRELLNFESNQSKLLQVVVFAQMDFLDRLRSMSNLLDRVNLLHILRPLTLRETRGMIAYRLQKAGLPPGRRLFSDGAVRLIHRASRGHPRQIIHLCHHSLLRAIMLQRDRVSSSMVRYAIGEREAALGKPGRPWAWRWAAGTTLALAAALLLYGLYVHQPFVPDEEVPRVSTWSALLEPPPREEGVPPMVRWAWAGGPFPKEEAASISEGPLESGSSDREPPRLLPWDPKAWFSQRAGVSTTLDSGRTVVIRRGDTLSGIAWSEYGVPLTPEWEERILAANPLLRSPHRLEPGQVLRLPPPRGGGGIHARPLGWFPELEEARRRAEGSTGEEAPLFLVRVSSGEGFLYGIYRGLSPGEGGEGEVIAPDQVLWVYDLPRGPHGE